MLNVESKKQCFLLAVCDNMNKTHANGIQRKRINILFLWMLKHKIYRRLLNQHYKISPKIIEGINSQVNRQEIYEYLYVNMIKTIDCFIYTGNFKRAIGIYKRFLEELKKKFYEKEIYETIS